MVNEAFTYNILSAYFNVSIKACLEWGISEPIFVCLSVAGPFHGKLCSFIGIDND